jgi:hypothetical protein
MNQTLWHSTIKLYIVTISYFILSGFWVFNKHPYLFNEKLGFLVLSLLFLFALIFKKLSTRSIAWLYIIEVLLLLISISINHQYYVENALRFQPYISIKLLGLFLALTAPALPWVGWTSLVATAAMPLLQYSYWPQAYQFQLPLQEPILTLCFVIVSGTIYLNRLYHLEILKKEIIISQKVLMLERLGGLVAGLQHLNNTPLQTIEMIIALLRTKHSESEIIIQTLERSYHAILRVNKLLGYCSSSHSNKSPSTIQELERDIIEIGKYLRT